ncbi:MAG: PAS domain S-box protein [Deltaproteobacteria bacterium]|nr:PAS domain S-box protein [Deltaproteobacteria bacterium]
MVEGLTYDSLKNRVEELEKEIFALRKAEERFRENEDRFRSLAETVSDIIWEIDRNGFINHVSRKVTDILGYQPDDFKGKRPFDFMPLQDNELEMKFHALAASQLPFNASENRFQHKNGRPVILESSGVPIFDVKGQFCGYRCLSRDITIKKDTDDEKELLESQLRQAQKMEAIGTLAGGIAHDFNNVLFPILGYTEMVMGEVSDNARIHKYLSEVFKAANRAKGLVQQILAFSRRSEHERQPLITQHIIKEALTLLRASIPSTIEIRTDIDKNCGPVNGDPTEIHQIIMNLCTNAFQAMVNKDGILSVDLKEVEFDLDDLPSGGLNCGTYVRLTVTDTGKGMSPDVIERIFNPYFTTKSPGEGTGLGLAVVHGIVKSYGGYISVHSKPDRGTTFHIYLPRIDSCNVSSETVLGDTVPRGTEHILLVDDEAPIVSMARNMMESLGYHVTSYLSSLDAFEAFCMAPAQFDLVITDHIMPHMTGMEFAQKLTGIRSDIPIMLWTGVAEALPEKITDKIGIRKCIAKPIVMNDMARAIRHVLDFQIEA